MARLNVMKLGHLASGLRTHEGAPARHITPEHHLRRSVSACLLWEDQFYEDGVAIAGRIAELVPQVEAEKVAALAVEAREQMKLRHVPLLLVREMARHPTHRALVAETLARVIQRADELAEFVAIYWQNGRVPLSAQVKKGLAAAFTKFDEYALAKYDRAGAVKLRDVLFLCHAKPLDEAQAAAVEAADRRRAGYARHLGGSSLVRRRTSARPGSDCSPSASSARSRCCATFAT